MSPKLNDSPSYFLFAACLIVLSNEFGSVYANPIYTAYIDVSIDIMRYCSATDPQADRLLYILRSFRAAVAEMKLNQGDVPTLPSPSTDSRHSMTSLFISHSSSKRMPAPSATPHHQSIGNNVGSSGPMSLAPQSLSTRNDDLANFAPGVKPGGAGTGTGVMAGISPSSSGAASSNAPLDAGDSLGPDAELDFDNLWGPWALGPSAGGHAADQHSSDGGMGASGHAYAASFAAPTSTYGISAPSGGPYHTMPAMSSLFMPSDYP